MKINNRTHRALFLAAALCFASAWLSLSAAQGTGETGTFVDSTDGKTYKTVVIGGRTWMAENLNIKTDNSWCYNNADSNCVKYGRLYTWSAAIAACRAAGPDWRLPSREEWGDLATAAGGFYTYGNGGMAGRALKSKTGWHKNGNGKDSLGFSALPGGYYSNFIHYHHNADRDSGSFYDAGRSGYWWTALDGDEWRKRYGWEKEVEENRWYAYVRYMDYAHGHAQNIHFDKNSGHSVRCVMVAPWKPSPAVADEYGGCFVDGMPLTGRRLRASIMRVIMDNYGHLRKAYVTRLREKPGMEGRITVKFVINEFGSVISAELIESNMRDPALEKTVLNAVKGWKFEKIDRPDDKHEVIYPFVFSP